MREKSLLPGCNNAEWRWAIAEYREHMPRQHRAFETSTNVLGPTGMERESGQASLFALAGTATRFVRDRDSLVELLFPGTDLRGSYRAATPAGCPFQLFSERLRECRHPWGYKMNRKIPVLKSSDTVEAKQQLVDSLRDEVRRMEVARVSHDKLPIASGCDALDGLLPAGGWQRGTLVEWLSAEPGSGAGTLALILARQAALEGGAVVILDRRQQFYPPAAAALGLDLENLIIVRSQQSADEIWALEQALRCPGVAAVWAPLDYLEWHAFRRLQLAAESGGSLGLLLRSGHVRRQPSWAHLQLWVEPVQRKEDKLADAAWLRNVRVEVTRCRQVETERPDQPRSARQGQGASVELELDETSALIRAVSRHETRPLHLATQLAHPKTRRCSARA